MTSTYLGDGLYASFDGYQIELRAPREHGDHYVALEPVVLDAFIAYVRRIMPNRFAADGDDAQTRSHNQRET